MDEEHSNSDYNSDSSIDSNIDSDIDEEEPSIDIEKDNILTNTTSNESKDIPSISLPNTSYISDDENTDIIDISLQNTEYKDNILINHPETKSINYKEMSLLTKIKRDTNGYINDNNHKTIPVLTKYEKTKILGQRAKQIENGASPLINVKNIIDHYIIAQMELEAKKIPFIVARPMPNGQYEYWKLTDLQII